MSVNTGPDQITINELLEYILQAASGMSKGELKVTIQEAVQCILCGLYGVSSNVKHEVKPVNGLVGLLKALNDPYVQLGLGLLVELTRSIGKCLDAA